MKIAEQDIPELKRDELGKGVRGKYAEHMTRMFNPPRPGEVLQEWLSEVSVTDAAVKLGVTRAHLSRILHGHTGITADMALRLAAALGTSPDMWLGVQSAYDLWQAEQKPRPDVLRLVA